MSRRKPRTEPAWWESEIIRLRPALRRFLSQKLPALPNEHEDWLQDTLRDLTQEVEERSEVYPVSWWQEASQVPRKDRARFRGLAHRILRHHIADWFGRRAKEWKLSLPEFGRAELSPAPDSSPERRYLMAQMLQICIEVLATASEEDRKIIARVTLGQDEKDQAVLSTKERQRLHRLRLKLSAEILKRLGSSASQLLAESE